MSTLEFSDMYHVFFKLLNIIGFWPGPALVI